jgi:hypothetical protein
MTKVSIALSQLSPTVASFLTLGLPFGPTFDAVSKAMALRQISILRHGLILPGSEASRFGLGFFRGKAGEFGNLDLCKESSIAVPSNGLGEGSASSFCDAPALWTLIWRFSRTCSLG